MPNSRCYEGTCLCLLGYQSVNQSTACLLRHIGDNCTIYEDCFKQWISAVVTSSLRHVPVTQDAIPFMDDNTHCVLRKIDDKCNVDSDCIDAVADSYCDVISCQCKSGYYVTRNGTMCTRRRISDECYLETDCSDAVTNSYCHKEPQETATTVTTFSSEDFFSNISTINFTYDNRTNQEMFSQSNFSLNETSLNDTNNLTSSHLNYNQSEWKMFTHLVTDNAKRSIENVAFEGSAESGANVNVTLQNVDVATNVTPPKHSMVSDTQNVSKRRNSTSTSFVPKIIMETLHSESSSPAAETTANPTEVSNQEISLPHTPMTL